MNNAMKMVAAARNTVYFRMNFFAICPFLGVFTSLHRRRSLSHLIYVYSLLSITKHIHVYHYKLTLCFILLWTTHVSVPALKHKRKYLAEVISVEKWKLLEL